MLHFGEIYEEDLFRELQSSFKETYASLFSNPARPRTIVVVPSLTLDHEILSKVQGHCYYEERMLCMLMLLKMPRTKIVFISSLPISPLIIDYYLHMLPGITGSHARSRLHLLSCYDAGDTPLTEKILGRPRLLERIKKLIEAESPAHLVFFNVTEAEKKLAMALQIPLYGCPPELNSLGTKSGSRAVFDAAGVRMPFGFINLHNINDVVDALTEIYRSNPGIKKAVLKLNDGFSGDGNAIFSYEGISGNETVWIAENFEQKLRIVAAGLCNSDYMEKMKQMGGIAEVFIDGADARSPSVQCRINPLGEISVLSTHDQILGGINNQVFLGASFPASVAYAPELATMGYKIAEILREKGVLGRFGIDFMSIRKGTEWEHYAIEINLRKGGTTHPYLMLQFLTEGSYYPEEGIYRVQNGTPRYYYATDNLQHAAYCGLTPPDLIEIAMDHGLHYDHTREEGVMFHLISALSQYGKTGLVSIGKSPEAAKKYYEEVVAVLNGETKNQARLV
jgi:hypothetical protein